MTPEDIAAHFTRADGTYFCARWGRAIAPVVFGVEDATLSTIKGAIEAVVDLAGHEVAETDPELGANLMVFFCRDWADLIGVPNLEKLVTGLGDLVTRLDGAGASQYRTFHFDEDGAIKACVVFIRMDDRLSQMPAEDIVLAQAAQVILCWGDSAFKTKSPLALANGNTVLRPVIGRIIRAAYDPVMPAVARDSSHAYRLAARLGE